MNRSDLTELNELIFSLEDTAKIPPDDYFDRLHRLDVSLRTHFGVFGELKDLDGSIVVNEEVIEPTRPGDPDCPEMPQLTTLRASCLEHSSVNLH